MKLSLWAALVQATACAGHFLRKNTSAVQEALMASKLNSPSCLQAPPTHYGFMAAANSTAKTMAAKSPEAHEFEHIYQTREWSANGAPLSGEGSTVGATQVLCQVLLAAIGKAAAHKPQGSNIRVLDAPSGDFHWMPTCLRAIDNMVANLHMTLTYQGVDVANSALQMSEGKRGQAQAGLRHVTISPFQNVNLAQAGSLAHLGQFDVVLSHDCIQHNPNAGIQAILNNFNSVTGFLVIDLDRGSYQGSSNFQDIALGGFRPVDISQPPYSFAAHCTDRNTAQHTAENEWFGILDLPLHK